MHVAFVTLQYPPGGIGGIGTYVQTVARTMTDAGHDVTVICVADGQTRSTTMEGGVRVERFAPPRPRWLWRRLVAPRQSLRVRVQHALWSAWALWRLGHRFDVVEVPEWKAQGLFLPMLRRGPVVVHLHLTFELEHAWNGTVPSRGQRLSYRLERRTATRAAARTATSRQTTRRPDGPPWIADDLVQIVAPPISVEEWSAIPSVIDTDPVVVFVGRLERRKAPEQLVEALGLLRDEVPGLRAVFAGRTMNTGGRPYVDVLEELAGHHGVACEFRDPISTRTGMVALYREARVVAVPSRFETLSMVALEAMAAGRPAVITDQVGAVEWIGDEFPELVVPFGDPRLLADALRPHLVSATHAADTGRRSHDLVASICAADQVVSSRLAVYQRLDAARHR